VETEWRPWLHATRHRIRGRIGQLIKGRKKAG
jgi:hypothetical protein